MVSGQTQDPRPSIDPRPRPVWVYTRRGQDRWFNANADYGPCAAQTLDSFGGKRGLCLAGSGRLRPCLRLAAQPHHLHPLEALVERVRGRDPADTGFIDKDRRPWLDQRHSVTVMTPTRARLQPSPHPCRLVRAWARWRKRVETVGSQLTERFAVARIRGPDLGPFQHRLIRHILAQSVMVFLNLQLGRPSLDFDGLVWD